MHPPDELVRAAVEAAMALARVQADDEAAPPPPRALRPFLRFTRLPDRAVAAARRVLDEDEGFRDQVRRSTSEDRVGRISWLFLDRPEGWEDELVRLAAEASEEADLAAQRQMESATARRVALADEARRRAEDATVRLGAELAETKELVATERRARRRVESDAGRARRRLADLEAELGRLRELVARLEATLEAPADVAEHGEGVEVFPEPNEHARPPGGLDVPVDLRALTASHAVALGAADALADALAELGRHLAPLLGTAEEKARDTALSSPRSSPPPRWRRPVALPPAILDDSVEAAEHLLRVDGVIVLVDGYNLTKRARPELALADQRRWLVDASVETATRTGARFEVVFDGADDRERAPADLHPRSGVQVRFSPTGTEADDVVVQRAETLAGEPVVVASDDRRVRDGAQRVGANVVGAAQLLAAMKRPLER